MLDLDRVACDACRLRCDRAKNFLGMLLYAYFVLSRRILDHLYVGRDRTKGRQDRQRGDSGADPLGQGDTVLDSFPSEVRPVRWYQDIGIHRLFLIRTGATGLMPAQLLRAGHAPVCWANNVRGAFQYRIRLVSLLIGCYSLLVSE
jgi:hypothetical protein